MIHLQNLELLAKEMCKFVNGLSPLIMGDLLTICEIRTSLQTLRL